MLDVSILKLIPPVTGAMRDMDSFKRMKINTTVSNVLKIVKSVHSIMIMDNLFAIDAKNHIFYLIKDSVL